MTQAPVSRLPGNLPLPDRLLAVATRMFAEKGFENTSVQEIVDAAGVTKGAMYHYFGSKDDLLYEIYHRLLALQMARLEQIADGPGTAEERLRAAAVDVLNTSFLHLDDFTVFFRSTHLLARDRRAAVRAERRRYHERFRALVEEGQREGTFRTATPADIAVHFFFGTVHQIGVWYRPGGGLKTAAISEHYVDLFLNGLRVPGGPEN
ncbi:TetR/AcrR family transcriptional regulator [Actinomadura decatromicini]|uniref:TetR/AcrR family transcriptional regulator n=1 Tax=Actinomadura decatromicini TaxID=2604572 RepID=A0A5D3F339_9ACTN|nr:TetR/AcrR family transcriptional regulator [Actinomadura decatromicini]TYK43427.1 TetR/AcrR family transcriptional regulator [Actinomadura decatromicini]